MFIRVMSIKNPKLNVPVDFIALLSCHVSPESVLELIHQETLLLHRFLISQISTLRRTFYQSSRRYSPTRVFVGLRVTVAVLHSHAESASGAQLHPAGPAHLSRFPSLQIMDGPGENDPDLAPAQHPRFCEAVQTDGAAYAALFTRTFQNKTFHVYRLKKKRRKTPRSPSESAAAP